MKAPAVCNTCGTIFPSPFDILAENVGFFNIGVGPCPKCGGNGSIPDGIYSFINNTILLLSNRKRTKLELQNLVSILTEAKQKQATPQELSQIIQDELPELSSLKDIFPKTRTELYAFVAIILTIITILITSLGRNPATKIEINQIVNVLYESQDGVKQTNSAVKKKLKVASKIETKKQRKIGRNHPCPCGSGKKYKKCCLNK